MDLLRHFIGKKTIMLQTVEVKREYVWALQAVVRTDHTYSNCSFEVFFVRRVGRLDRSR